MRGHAESAPKAGLLRPVEPTRLYEQLMERLVEYCDAAGLRAGDRIPAERELAVGLGVSRASLRQAIVALEVQGILERRRGDGTYLRRPVSSGDWLRTLSERRQRLPEILEARAVLEIRLAELAAQRRTAEDLDAMDKALAMAEEGLAVSVADTTAPDLEPGQRFHAAVVTAARNSVLAAIMTELRDSFAESTREALAEPNRWPRLIEEHRRVADAIRRRDPAEAAEAMRAHLADIADVRLLRWQPDEDS